MAPPFLANGSRSGRRCRWMPEPCLCWSRKIAFRCNPAAGAQRGACSGPSPVLRRAVSEAIAGTRAAKGAERAVRATEQDLCEGSYTIGFAVRKARPTQVGVGVKRDTVFGLMVPAEVPSKAEPMIEIACNGNARPVLIHSVAYT